MKFCVSQVRLVELGFKLIPHRFECQPIGYRLGFADLSQVVVQLVVLRKVYVFVIAQRHFDFLSDGCLAVAYVYVWPFANISTVLAEVRGTDLTRFLGQEMFCGHRLHAGSLPKPDQGCAPIPNFGFKSGIDFSDKASDVENFQPFGGKKAHTIYRWLIGCVMPITKKLHFFTSHLPI